MLNLHFDRKYHFVKLKSSVFVMFLATFSGGVCEYIHLNHTEESTK